MSEAGILHCPDCGAPADPTAVRCDHCQAVLQTLSCADCLALNFVRSKHCSRCGAKLFAPVEQPSATRRCPRCRLGLEECAVGDAIVGVCNRCGGLWVDSESFRRICERREKSAAFVGLGSPLVAPGAQVSQVTGDTVRYISCPACGKLMNRVNFARCSGVVVDVCRGDGTWFDKDELERILDFIAAGGLEKARDQAIEAQKRETARLRGQRAAAAGDAAEAEGQHYAGVVDAVGDLLGFFLT